MKCAHFAVLTCTCETRPHAHMYVLNTTPPRHQSTKLRIMTNSIKTKVLTKFGGSEMICVELRPRKLRNVHTLPYLHVHVKPSFSHVLNTHTPPPCHQSTKLRILTISIKTKVLTKFGGSEMICVELRPRKLRCVYTLPYTRETLMLTCTEHTSNMSPVNETQNYD